MIIVDDRLSLDVLAGRLEGDEAFATTWGFHYRLVRALTDASRPGALSSAVPDDVATVALSPPRTLLEVLDPRGVTQTAATLAVRHGLNLLAAELVASAVRYGATVRLRERNVGRDWPAIFDAEGVVLERVG